MSFKIGFIFLKFVEHLLLSVVAKCRDRIDLWLVEVVETWLFNFILGVLSFVCEVYGSAGSVGFISLSLLDRSIHGIVNMELTLDIRFQINGEIAHARIDLLIFHRNFFFASLLPLIS